MKAFRRMTPFVLALGLISVLAGCESAEEKRERVAFEREYALEKLRSGQTAIENEQAHERRMAHIQRPVMPVAPGAYVDYRGNVEYGSWTLLGWVWHDRESPYAIQSRRYVDYQIATGYYDDDYLDTPYTQKRWTSTHKNGWKKTNVTVNNYTSVKGETLSASQYKSNVKKAEVKNTKWKKAKQTQSTYAKGGFKNSFAKAKKEKAAKDAKIAATTKKPVVKSTYAKQTKTVNTTVDKNKQKQADLKAKLKAKQKAKADKAAKAKRERAAKIARDKAAAKARAKRAAKQKKQQQKKQNR